RYKTPVKCHIQINEYEMNRLKNQTLYVRTGRGARPLHLNSDGTIGPPYYPGLGRYWFVHNKADGVKIAIASETEILREFAPAGHGAWESVQELRTEAA